MYSNPSGVYALKMSKELIEETRKNIADFINAKPENIFFTSGGTESDNWALENSKNNGKHIITSKIEHHAILNKCQQLEKDKMKATYLNVDSQGVVNADDVERNIRDDTAIISIMFANNEIGTIEPVKEIGKIAKEHNIIFHTDAVQAFGHVSIDVEEMNLDMMSVSSHKFHGPKGVGFLYVRNPEKMIPLIYGGGQERGKRSGTENVIGIAGMNGALQEVMSNFNDRVQKETNLRNYLINRVLSEIPYIKLNGSMARRLPGNANFTIAGVDGTSLVVLMDNDGICISSGSACSSGSDAPSHVISAIGVPEKFAYGTVRITLCSDNTKEEIDYTIHRLKENIKMLRSR
ncbi:MAG: cysteine desulfurase family protein [Eubacterium sp.]